MHDIFQQWWAWMAAGIVFGILEVVIPTFVFLGFAAGAGITGVLLALGVQMDLPPLLLVFSLASLVSWLLIRKVAGERKGQIKRVHHDINEN